jgi:hypothetical protein
MTAMLVMDVAGLAMIMMVMVAATMERRLSPATRPSAALRSRLLP